MTDSEEGSTAFSKSLPRAVCLFDLGTILTLTYSSVTLVESARFVVTKPHLAPIARLLEYHAKSLAEAMT